MEPVCQNCGTKIDADRRPRSPFMKCFSCGAAVDTRTPAPAPEPEPQS